MTFLSKGLNSKLAQEGFSKLVRWFGIELFHDFLAEMLVTKANLTK